MINPIYLDMISKKLDALNKIDGSKGGFRPNKPLDDYNPNVIDAIGSAGLAYMNNRKINQNEYTIDPLFRDHNK